MSTTPANRFVLVATEWFDGERRHAHGPTTFKVVDGRLAGLAEGDHGETLAAQGWPLQRVAFLMPGLVDAHVHLFLDGGPTDQATRSAHLKQNVEQLTDAARRSARQNLAAGVTLVRDAGDRHGINNRVRDEACDPLAGLARVRSGGLGVKRAKRYGTFMATDVDDATSIRGSVTKLAEANDEIKLILTGIIDFDAGTVTDEPQFDIPAARLVVETAHACGRKVFAHCSGVKGLDVAVEAGVDAIEHGFFMTREHLLKMRDRGLAWTPTFCPVHFQWAQPDAVGWSANTVGNLRRILDDHAEHLRLADELGVRLLLGTDAGSMGVVHGLALAEEADRFQEAGLGVDAVLRAATSAARWHFGMAQPRLAVGAPWEAVALGASPFGMGKLSQALGRVERVWLGQGA
ncbi:amidohydrolase family protein [Sphaerotilus microaerophilus]|uniref:Amidohydrolase n=1 Tax=Sphaerotilus microaerophilus TaxID=2914710 RepID=A0ABM7YGT9_9BURK|nr:amidohydrolase family protein [Sphaerotilus sp. FB-5]BDI03371.1 amidohydrolase [Sphaerotilus sp. FB-5]